mmetsp:Transcript_3511/g.5161  ORF Transcript_3511/g.5161 Transcript_3511/m.5161 type:complete len:99 (+) Transcript_3511:75-371(+)
MKKFQIEEVLPKAGLVYSEKSTLSELLSKPKIMPLKSINLEKIEAMEKEARQKGFVIPPKQRPQTSMKLNQVKNVQEAAPQGEGDDEEEEPQILRNDE